MRSKPPDMNEALLKMAAGHRASDAESAKSFEISHWFISGSDDNGRLRGERRVISLSAPHDVRKVEIPR